MRASRWRCCACPNLNVEPFEWSSSDRRTEHPRHNDVGGHHLCFVVDDVDRAIAVLRDIPGVRLLGDRPPRRRLRVPVVLHCARSLRREHGAPEGL
jgi:catechol 2,3-dioxygenase-like lactoylglutathione lyase family enzyme